MNSKVFDLYSFTREEVSDYIEMGNFQSAIIPTGSTEQHLDHLAVNMDIEMSRYIATKSAEELYPNTLITSPISTPIFFASPFHFKLSTVILPSISDRIMPASSKEYWFSKSY